MRVYELSKLLGVSSKDLVAALSQKGYELSSHMSILSSEMELFLRQKFMPNASTVSQSFQKKEVVSGPESRLSPVEAKDMATEKNKNLGDNLQIPVGEILVTPMLVGDFARQAGKPVAEVILSLLRSGVACAKNQTISATLVEQLARQYGLKVASPQRKNEAVEKVAIGGVLGAERMPVVVVIGHVDHGKTTLLDYIRKTRVAAREKGGITQHLGAYEVSTPQGNIVFLDTPGHEAFTRMRSRGIRIADIAILVVAADDGIKPQTIEAIKHAKSVQIPVIVALNKVDKASPAQIEAAKRGLAQYDLVPEEWGGQVVIAPVSAKFGTGVEHLLEIIALQAQLMDLRAEQSGPAEGFVLEAKIEKGFGPVATIIGQRGMLKMGDCFVAGGSVGKVSSIINSAGARIQQAGPSIPVRVAGFDQLPEAGDSFKVVSQDEYKRSRSDRGRNVPVEQKQLQQENSADSIRIILKADNNSSKEAIIGSIDQLSVKSDMRQIQVVHSAVGDINESDVALAANTGCMLYAFNVKADPKAAVYAQKAGVVIKPYQIIYQLLDDIASRAQKAPEVRYVSTRVGEASVLCVFKIKNIGIVAGAKVIDGRLARDGKVIVKRGRNKVGEGVIKTLERDRKSVKEVHAGFECAFVINGFEEWEVDDRVECFIDVPSSAAKK